jgi:hypothetical protein
MSGFESGKQSGKFIPAVTAPASISPKELS